MKAKRTSAKRSLLRWVAPLMFLLLLLCLQNLRAQSSAGHQSAWEFGLTGELFNRGLKWEEQTSSLKATNLLLEIRGRNLSNFFNLRMFAGLEQARLNGIIFDQLPITLEYQGGALSGLIFGARADARFYRTSTFSLGVLADFTSYIGFKKSFTMQGFVVPAEATAEPAWAQASVGLMVAYDGLENSQPYLEVAGSLLWGAFKMTERIEDLSGEQSVDLKGSGYLSLTFGWNFFLVDKITVSPRIRVFPGSKTAVGAGITFFYGF